MEIVFVVFSLILLFNTILLIGIAGTLVKFIKLYKEESKGNRFEKQNRVVSYADVASMQPINNQNWDGLSKINSKNWDGIPRQE